MVIHGVSGQVLNPQWSGDGTTTECGGITKVIDGDHIQINHIV